MRKAGGILSGKQGFKGAFGRYRVKRAETGWRSGMIRPFVWRQSEPGKDGSITRGGTAVMNPGLIHRWLAR
ncbi:MAG: hypothetical protein J1F12_05395 [Muribaculaceae bacterium]|nr:hypothetical protein [Muribaculaceae bacterium]